MHDQINMAMKNLPDQLTVDMFTNYEKSVKHFVSDSKVSYKDIPACWKRSDIGQIIMLFNVDCTN